MVKELIHDTIFLGQKSQTANADDIKIANDLLDTLKYYQDECVGMAANMIGVKKRIIAFNDRGKFTVMFNLHSDISLEKDVIVARSKEEAEKIKKGEFIKKEDKKNKKDNKESGEDENKKDDTTSIDKENNKNIK